MLLTYIMTRALQIWFHETRWSIELWVHWGIVVIAGLLVSMSKASSLALNADEPGLCICLLTKLSNGNNSVTHHVQFGLKACVSHKHPILSHAPHATLEQE